MSKKKDTTTPEVSEPDFLKELKEKGTTVVSAKTREELADVIDNIPADVRYGAGAVGFSYETGLFTLRLDLITK